jgi:hypothetical protein
MAQLIALATTLIVEGVGMAFFALLLPGWRPHWRKAVVLALAVNLVTHTIFWVALPYLAPRPAPVIPLAEVVVVLLEGAVYALTVARPRWSAWAVSFVLNWASWLLAAFAWQFLP